MISCTACSRGHRILLEPRILEIYPRTITWSDEQQYAKILTLRCSKLSKHAWSRETLFWGIMMRSWPTHENWQSYPSLQPYLLFSYKQDIPHLSNPDALSLFVQQPFVETIHKMPLIGLEFYLLDIVMAFLETEGLPSNLQNLSQMSNLKRIIIDDQPNGANREWLSTKVGLYSFAWRSRWKLTDWGFSKLVRLSFPCFLSWLASDANFGICFRYWSNFVSVLRAGSWGWRGYIYLEAVWKAWITFFFTLHKNKLHGLFLAINCET